MKPSQDALDIDAAHKLYRAAMGTPWEALAKLNLELAVALAKARAAS